MEYSKNWKKMCFEPTTQNINIESVQHFEARTNIEIAE